MKKKKNQLQKSNLINKDANSLSHNTHGDGEILKRVIKKRMQIKLLNLEFGYYRLLRRCLNAEKQQKIRKTK